MFDLCASHVYPLYSPLMEEILYHRVKHLFINFGVEIYDLNYAHGFSAIEIFKSYS